MNNIFKIGDYVILVDAIGIHNIELNKVYKIADIYKNKIALEGIYESNNELYYFSFKRFKSAIKIQRTEKLKKILNCE